jgi:HK97 family phage prohead protease
MTRTTELAGHLRATDDPLVFEGTAVPYGALTVSPVPEFGVPEAFAPHAFKDSAEFWMSRGDGTRMSYRPKHGADDIGTITALRDEDAGLGFTLRLDDDPAGHAYAKKARAGRNGVSIEFAPVGEPERRDGFVLHRQAKLYAIAGSVTPAYDGARLSLRDMEVQPVPESPTPPEPTPTPPAPAPAPPEVADPPPTRTTAQVSAERSQVQALGGGAADHSTHAALSMFRDAAIYGRDAVDEQGNHRSFLRDLVNSNRDSGARERIEKHHRMLTDFSIAMERAGDVLSSEIPGAYPNLYLPGVFTPRILKGRPMANFINSFPIADALPRIFAKVSTSTTATVQASQTTNPAASDFATTAVTATPLLYGASSLVARQVVDGASPAAEQMLLQDMYEAYGQVTEAATVTAVEAGATASGTAITAATPYAGTLGNVIKYYATRFNPAEGQFYPSALFSVLLAQGDTTGRPFLPAFGLVNSDGSTLGGAAGFNILGSQGILSWGSTVNVVVTLRKADYVIFESPTLSFRYEQATGPAAFNIGVWGYFVCATRLGGLSVTAA